MLKIFTFALVYDTTVIGVFVWMDNWFGVILMSLLACWHLFSYVKYIYLIIKNKSRSEMLDFMAMYPSEMLKHRVATLHKLDAISRIRLDEHLKKENEKREKEDEWKSEIE